MIYAILSAIFVLSTSAAFGQERQATIQVAYRMPEASTFHLTTPVSDALSLGLIAEVKPGSHDTVEEYSGMGWRMVGIQADYYFGAHAKSFADSWLISSWAAMGVGGLENGRQRFTHVASTAAYQWMWQSGFNVQAGLGVQWRAWESPRMPANFGSVFPNATIAGGWSF